MSTLTTWTPRAPGIKDLIGNYKAWIDHFGAFIDNFDACINNHKTWINNYKGWIDIQSGWEDAIFSRWLDRKPTTFCLPGIAGAGKFQMVPPSAKQFPLDFTPKRFLPNSSHDLPKKRCLPMLLNGCLYKTTPDTGSSENAISADEVRRLRLDISGHRREFLMADGSRTLSLGNVRLECAFAQGEHCTTWQLFNVFDNLAVPVIIGKKFLDVSETLTLYQNRLDIDWTAPKNGFRVMHLSQPRQLMRCFVNGKLVHANPDTGSEVDLMSPIYACENMLNIQGLEEGEDRVQFADGRTAKLLGKTQVDLDIYDGHYGFPTGHKGHSRTFYILDGLTTEILLGEEALFDMQVFTDHADSFVYLDDGALPNPINLITWFDKRGRQMSDTLALLSSARSQQMTSSGVQTLLNKLHARELHQRELASQKLAALPAAERLVQERLEQARRLEYDVARDLLIQRRNIAAPSSSAWRTIPPPV